MNDQPKTSGINQPFPDLCAMVREQARGAVDRSGSKLLIDEAASLEELVQRNCVALRVAIVLDRIHRRDRGDSKFGTLTVLEQLLQFIERSPQSR